MKDWFERFFRRHATCVHKSHLLGLPCTRPRLWDHYCHKHNDSCYYNCETAVW